MADNLDPGMGNQDQTPEVEITPPAGTTAPAAPATETTVSPNVETGSFSWKGKLGEDLSGAPAMQKFEDTAEGLQNAVKSHVELEHLLGNEKVPIPKGPDDLEGISRFNKALGIPDKAEGYKLSEPSLPEDMKGMSFDRDSFAVIAHANGLTPTQAEGLWKTYTDGAGSVYAGHLKAAQDKMNENINALRAEWGDAFPANVELGEMVIAKFADDQDMGDFLTATLSKDPAGMKFLAKIGEQFQENKIGEFKYKKFSVSPDEAADEITKIKNDPKHPYNDQKATNKDHDMAVDQVNRLISISRGKKG